MLLFRDEEHAQRWCRQRGQPFGAAFTLETAWRLALAWYGPDRRDPGWRRPSVEEAEAILAGVGLTGPFWALRG